MINIVLYQPEIPPNTGNIARLCVCNDFVLHLIHPIGFSLSRKQVVRAGLDYWHHVQLREHASWEHFVEEAGLEGREKFHFFSSRAQKSYWKTKFTPECYLIFGSETGGLPVRFHKDYARQFVTIPMTGKKARCLNLSNSVSIAAYEAMRQLGI